MTPKEFRIALAALGMSQADMARHLKVKPHTTSRWAKGTHPIPYPVALVIGKMVEDLEREETYAREELPQ